MGRVLVWQIRWLATQPGFCACLACGALGPWLLASLVPLAVTSYATDSSSVSGALFFLLLLGGTVLGLTGWGHLEALTAPLSASRRLLLRVQAVVVPGLLLLTWTWILQALLYGRFPPAVALARPTLALAHIGALGFLVLALPVKSGFRSFALLGLAWLVPASLSASNVLVLALDFGRHLSPRAEIPTSWPALLQVGAPIISLLSFGIALEKVARPGP